MKRLFDVHSIRHKLSIGILLTTLTALFISGFIMVVYDLHDYRERTLEDMQTQADLIGQSSIAALQFNDPNVANQTLSLLRLRPQIKAAAIYTPDGEIFAHYVANGLPINSLPARPSSDTFDIQNRQISLPRQIIFANQTLGMVYLVADYPFYERLARNISVIVAVAVVALVISMLMSLWILSKLTRPILAITKLAQGVVERQDYSSRAEKISDDEIGYLVDAFNNMLSEIERRTNALQLSNQYLNQKIEQHDIAEKALRSSEHRHKTLISALSSVVWLADNGGHFVNEQPQWQQYTGQAPEEYADHGWLQAFHKDDRPILTAHWQNTSVANNSHRLHLRLWHETTHGYRHINLHAVPLKAENDTKLQWIGVIDDIHEQWQANAEIKRLNAELEYRVEQRTTALEKANKELEAFSQQLIVAKETAELASQTKDSFLATMSHEIRTPLTGMLGMLEVLSMTSLNHEQEATLKAAWDSARNLLRIVNDILDWSKIQDGKLTLSPRSISIPLLLQEVVDTYSRVASAKNLKLWQHTDYQLSAAHIVDPLRLSQILNNFVSNALKFTEQGEIEVSAELLEQLESGERIRFAIKDTGIGITKDVQQNLFKRFQQESADTARQYGGTGLGLSICRCLAELLDGQLELVSEPGLGAIFSLTVILPISAAPGEQIPTLAPVVEQKKLTPLFDNNEDAPMILAVDDHPINRELLARQIQLLGLRAETAEDGLVALSKWKTGRFALVITDCHMPEMDGYGFARAVRNIETEEKLSHTPIIAWTANARSEEGQFCWDAGMDELLVKPTDLTRLKMMLAKWLSIPETDDSQATASPHNADGQTKCPIDYAEFSKVVPDSIEQRQVLHDFQQYISADRAKLIALLAQGDPLMVQHTAHRMKGSCRMVGATEMATACATIEQTARAKDIDGARTKITELNATFDWFDRYLAELTTL